VRWSKACRSKPLGGGGGVLYSKEKQCAPLIQLISSVSDGANACTADPTIQGDGSRVQRLKC
jgi:hypothetical protein